MPLHNWMTRTIIDDQCPMTLGVGAKIKDEFFYQDIIIKNVKCWCFYILYNKHTFNFCNSVAEMYPLKLQQCFNTWVLFQQAFALEDKMFL